MIGSLMKPTKLLAVLEHQEFPKALPMYVIIPKNKVKNYAIKKFSKLILPVFKLHGIKAESQ